MIDSKYKGIILDGGHGSRLYPATEVISKQLLTVYDKPMIYYALSVLMLAGIREILLISTHSALPLFEQLLGDGANFGINIQYIAQKHPNGLAEAFLLGENFIQQRSVCLILGDNIFYGNGLTALLKQAQTNSGATIFAYQVVDSTRYGIVEFTDNNTVISIEEKPALPKSNFAVTGLYFYDNKVVSYAKQLIPSQRGELEITDINQCYLDHTSLNVIPLARGFNWLDAGTHDSLTEASNFIQKIQQRQLSKIACLEEIALRNKWVSAAQIKERFAAYNKDNSYVRYVHSLCYS